MTSDPSFERHAVSTAAAQVGPTGSDDHERRTVSLDHGQSGGAGLDGEPAVGQVDAQRSRRALAGRRPAPALAEGDERARRRGSWPRRRVHHRCARSCRARPRGRPRRSRGPRPWWAGSEPAGGRPGRDRPPRRRPRQRASGGAGAAPAGAVFSGTGSVDAAAAGAAGIGAGPRAAEGGRSKGLEDRELTTELGVAGSVSKPGSRFDLVGIAAGGRGAVGSGDCSPRSSGAGAAAPAASSGVGRLVRRRSAGRSRRHPAADRTRDERGRLRARDERRQLGRRTGDGQVGGRGQLAFEVELHRLADRRRVEQVGARHPLLDRRRPARERLDGLRTQARRGQLGRVPHLAGADRVRRRLDPDLLRVVPG